MIILFSILSKIEIDEKLKSFLMYLDIFRIMDQDDDGCLTLDEI